MSIILLVPIAIVVIVAAYFRIYKKLNILSSEYLIMFVVVSLLYLGICAAIGYGSISAQEYDTENWSGKIIGHYHKEEWDEWHPPRTETYTTTVNGKSVTHTRTIPGYWEHHPAVNRIQTSDAGEISVHYGMNGVALNDSWPNTTQELASVFPLGTPTASTHSYKNKVQASYSIFKHKDINLKDYPDLPDYPQVTDYFMIRQAIGDIPNKEQVNLKLMALNTELNKMIDDPEKPGKKRSWKQVNIILVNLKGQPQEAAFALQDKWENGNKNDFVVAFDYSEGKFNWVYPFSWSDAEMAKVSVRDSLMEMKDVQSFEPVVDLVGELVAQHFVRKQFADFEYIQVDVHPIAKGVWLVLSGLYLGFFLHVMRSELAFSQKHNFTRGPLRTFRTMTTSKRNYWT